VHNNGLVKTIGFKDPKYVGDPINAVKIFNEKEVDELMVLDIDASVAQREPNFELIKKLAIECRMPFCYGGGVNSVKHAKKIIGLGAEKVALSSAAVLQPELLKAIGNAVGVQSVVVVLDVKKKGLFGGNYEIYIHNGKKSTGIKLKNFLSKLNEIGVGELVINSIEKDGSMTGYDEELIRLVRESVDFPMSVLGGAGSYEDVIIGVAAGSLFVFKGKYRAVLINYPTKEEKNNILN
jgi:cyclase